MSKGVEGHLCFFVCHKSLASILENLEVKMLSQNGDGHFAFGRVIPESFTEQVPTALLTVCHVIHHAKLNQQGVKRQL